MLRGIDYVRYTRYRCGHEGRKPVNNLLDVGSYHSKEICKECKEKKIKTLPQVRK